MKDTICNNTNGNDWSHCSICGGRVHEVECTTKKVKGKDCLNNHTKEEYQAIYGN